MKSCEIGQELLSLVSHAGPVCQNPATPMSDALASPQVCKSAGSLAQASFLPPSIHVFQDFSNSVLKNWAKMEFSASTDEMVHSESPIVEILTGSSTSPSNTVVTRRHSMRNPMSSDH